MQDKRLGRRRSKKLYGKGNNVATWTPSPRTFGQPTRPEEGATKVIRLGPTLKYPLPKPAKHIRYIKPILVHHRHQRVAPFLFLIRLGSLVETANQPWILADASANESEGAFVLRLRPLWLAIRLGEYTGETPRERGESLPVEKMPPPPPAATPQSKPTLDYHPVDNFACCIALPFPPPAQLATKLGPGIEGLRWRSAVPPRPCMRLRTNPVTNAVGP